MAIYIIAKLCFMHSCFSSFSHHDVYSIIVLQLKSEILRPSGMCFHRCHFQRNVLLLSSGHMEIAGSFELSHPSTELNGVISQETAILILTTVQAPNLINSKPFTKLWCGNKFLSFYE